MRVRHTLLLCCIALLQVLAGCGERPAPEGFVRMEHGRLLLHGEPWFPMVMNYMALHRTDGRDMWPVAYRGYTEDYGVRYHDREGALQELKADLLLMRQLGFDAVRVVKLAEGPRRGEGSASGWVHAETMQLRDTLLSLDDAKVREAYLASVGTFMRLADEAGLKVILLSTVHEGRPDTRDHLVHVARRFRDDPTVLAFDLFNEPLYFDSVQRRKPEIHRISQGWRKLMRQHAPHHLITIGLAGIREVHAWDPDILDVDFISFHPYEYEPDQVRNEIRWYQRHVRTPWMIGETSLPCDGDSIPFEEQARFAMQTLRQTRACGGIGYSWWQLKDVRWGKFHSDRMGLVAWGGETPVVGATVTATGTIKPSAELFRSFDPAADAGPCLEASNYRNYSEHRSARLAGRLLDDAGAPIEGAVVLGWNEHFSHSYHTTTDAEGLFELRGDMYFHHWIASATGHDMVRGDATPLAYRRAADSIPTFDLGPLLIGRLPFAR